ncbi:MAG TPA: threonine synthase [Thermotogota bacterium]|nr:threonine synthase [Thermotogota bacterium]
MPLGGKSSAPWKRYLSFFPAFVGEKMGALSMGEGNTPLVEVPSLRQQAGTGALFLKNETTNPSWSFKDRGTVTALCHAQWLGFSTIGTVSTGNMAMSVASYGAFTGHKTVVLVRAGMEEGKLRAIEEFSPVLVEVDGAYDMVFQESLRLGEKAGVYFMNSDAPFRVEGYKTLAFELFEQLGGEVPDYVVVPTSAGGNIRGIEKGFRELKASGYATKIPVMVCAQAAGCAPIWRAFAQKSPRIQREANPHTVAHAIENPHPPSGNAVLRMLQKNGGLCEAVSEEEIHYARKMLARNGFLVQAASAVGLAAVLSLSGKGFWTGSEKVVLVLTGSGLKTPGQWGAGGKKKTPRFKVGLENLPEVLAMLR